MRRDDPAYRTARARALVAAVVTAVAVSALLTGINSVMNRYIDWAKHGLHPPSLLSLALSSFTNTAVTIAVVAPLWWWLDRKGHRHWRAAMLVGGLGGALMSTVLELAAGGRVSEGVQYFDLTMTLLGAVPGALVGLVMWRIAYRRDPGAAEVAEAF